ncbi:hypothetical protein [Nocardia yunnanensis]|nr:hypothetical protein [Nocardia yunnanensis]
MIDGLKQWDGAEAPTFQDHDGDDVRELMSESIAAFAKLGIRVEYRTS